MFIKLTFINPIGAHQQRAIKISRIQEVKPSQFEGSEILISGYPEAQLVCESFDEIFGIIQPSDELVEV
jgi:hypothetical protein